MGVRPTVSVVSDERKREIQENIGYDFRAPGLIDTVFIRPEDARELNKGRRPGRYVDDNSSLRELGMAFLVTLSCQPGFQLTTGQGASFPIDGDLVILLIGAVALDSSWNVETTAAVVSRIFAEDVQLPSQNEVVRTSLDSTGCP